MHQYKRTIPVRSFSDFFSLNIINKNMYNSEKKHNLAFIHNYGEMGKKFKK